MVMASNFFFSILDVIQVLNDLTCRENLVIFRELPDFLGGRCTSENDGGCLRSDKGPWRTLKEISMVNMDCSLRF